jgi:DNA-3-methyladenine glycosylase I
MSKANVRKQILEKNSIFIKEKEKPLSSQGLFTKHLKRVYPIGLHRSSSSLSLSSVSLSLSQNSNDSSLTDCSATPLEQKISLALRLISPSERREVPVARNFQTRQQRQRQQQQQKQDQGSNDGELKRCNWITKNSGIV